MKKILTHTFRTSSSENVIRVLKNVTSIGRRKKGKRFQTKEFIFDEENNRFVCSAGKYLKYERNQKLKNSEGRFYRSRYRDCRVCKKKERCLKTEKSKHRSIYVTDNFFNRNHSEEMMKKIDTADGRDML